tara:strand:- start:479 stop:1054 length:576 start_codon:yes stop_codon:yes gene_type:complete
MSRTIGTNFRNQIESSRIRPFYAVEIAFKSGTIRTWTGFGSITISSETYIGTGNLLNISNVNETADVRATGIKITLSGIDSSLLSSSLNQDAENGTIKLFFGVLETSSNAQSVVDTPYLLFSGFLDTISVQEDGGKSIITVSGESKLITLERGANRRYTDQDQKNLFAGDRGLEFIDSLQDKQLFWGGGSR